MIIRKLLISYAFATYVLEHVILVIAPSKSSALRKPCASVMTAVCFKIQDLMALIKPIKEKYTLSFLSLFSLGCTSLLFFMRAELVWTYEGAAHTM